MKLSTNNIIFLVLAILWMILIFHFSAQRDVVSQQESHHVDRLYFGLFGLDFEGLSEEEQILAAEKVDLIVRKSAHVFEYFVLGTLFYFTFKGAVKHPYLFALGASALYACSDEVHQLFVQGRSGEVRDALIDTGGALLALLLIRLIQRLRQRKRKEAQSN